MRVCFDQRVKVHVRAVLMLIQLVVAHSAMAGHYQVSYPSSISSNVLSFTSPSFTTHYSTSPSVFVDQTDGVISSTANRVTAGGAVSATATWIHDDPAHPTNDPHPQQVVISESSKAAFKYIGFYILASSGTCSNGLGDTAVYTFQGPMKSEGTSSGTTYSIQTGADSLTISGCSPSIDYTVQSYYPGFQQLEGTVSYTATVYPLDIGVSSEFSSNAVVFAIGQLATGNILNSSPLSITTYNWTTSGGHPFAGASYSASSGSQTPAPANETTSQFTSYYGDAGTVTLNCAIHLDVPAGAKPTSGFDRSLTKTFSTVKPSYSAGPSYTLGTTHGVPSNSAATVVGLWDTLGGAGLVLTCGITDPSGVGTGHSGWNYVQLVNLNRTRVSVATGLTERLAMWSEHPPGTWVAVTSGLDSTYPYEPSSDPDVTSWPPDGVSHTASDAPNESLDTTASQYTIGDTFDTYIMYHPPGLTSVFVPLHHFAWNWGAQAGLSGSTFVLSSCTQGVSANADTTTSPAWTTLITLPSATYR